MVVLDDPFVFILRPAKQGCTSFLRKSRASRKLLRRRDNGERGIGCDANAEIDLHSVGADRHWDGLDARQVQAFSHHGAAGIFDQGAAARSEEHTSELQSLMRISYAVFCLQKKNLQIELYLYLLL